MMRRFLTITGLLLALGCVACDPNDPKVDAANKAVDATSEMPGWFGLIGSLGGIALSAFGLRRAGVGAKYAEGGWSKEEVDELVVALRGHGYKVERV